jgi:hypothetical protein
LTGVGAICTGVGLILTVAGAICTVAGVTWAGVGVIWATVGAVVCSLSVAARTLRRGQATRKAAAPVFFRMKPKKNGCGRLYEKNFFALLFFIFFSTWHTGCLLPFNLSICLFAVSWCNQV